MHITFVKKILASGEPCQKCLDVEERLNASGQMEQIDQILIADERDANSPGMLLATELNVPRAPFFVVEREDSKKQVYTVYFKFAKEVFGQKNKKTDEAKEILNDNPDLDYI